MLSTVGNITYTNPILGGIFTAINGTNIYVNPTLMLSGGNLAVSDPAQAYYETITLSPALKSIFDLITLDGGANLATDPNFDTFLALNVSGISASAWEGAAMYP
jgi:hypothetical protein